MDNFDDEQVKREAAECLRQMNAETDVLLSKYDPAYLEAKANYIKSAVGHNLKGFIKETLLNAQSKAIPTGFKKLDKLLDDGLRSGLYIVGAVSSLGKTTFCLQIADQIAQSGADVLVFSLEMKKSELIAKSISRLSYLYAEDDGLNCLKLAKTTLGILQGSRYSHYHADEKDVIDKCINKYGEYAKNIYIVEGIGDVGVTEITETVKNHIEFTGKTPVILIDYLQILAPYDDRATDKQNTDKNVLELKRLSRDYNLPVIGISSFNRDNYNAPVNVASFKESGAIEYSSDVLIGLQYDFMEYKEGENEKARINRIRGDVKKANKNAADGIPNTIQAKVLKNRNGAKGFIYFDFVPKYNYFEECAEQDKDKPIDWQSNIV